MPVNAYTEYRCDKCEGKEREQGTALAHADSLPEGWAEYSIKMYAARDMMPTLKEGILCPKCTRIIAQALGQKRKYIKKQVKEPEIVKET